MKKNDNGFLRNRSKTRKCLLRVENVLVNVNALIKIRVIIKKNERVLGIIGMVSFCM